MTDKKEATKAFLIRTLADPVLIYAVIAITAIMNHYRSTLAFVFGIVAYALGWLVFRLFDYVNKHHVIGFFAYIALFALFVMASSAFMDQGQKGYNVSWGLWFMTPQDAMQYNKWYTLAVFVLFLIFMLSVIYYFTRVRYRLFMNFLILAIPFSIYGKENETMDIGYIIALCVGFFIIVANFRQMSDTKEAKVIDRGEMFGSAAVFAVIFALISSLVPKPTVEADRTVIDSVLNAEALTDRFLKMLDLFRDDSSGQQFRQNMGDIPLYYATSPQPLQLKTSTFSEYSFENDTWKISDTDSRYWYRNEKPFPIYYDSGLAEAILYAAEKSDRFCQEYDLSEFVEKGLEIPQERRMTITAVRQGGQTAPVPAGAVRMQSSSYDETLGLTKSGIIFAHDSEFKEREQFSYAFVSPSFFGYEGNVEFASHIAEIEDYSAMLSSAEWAIIDDSSEEGKKYYDILQENSEFYEFAEENLLDYGNNQRIYDLAQKITGKFETPIEKAKALEYYFIENDFTYDLDYRKSAGENAEDFLFETKRGVCYEYATAMTLLARASGIPARYCEGFNMQTKYGDTNGDSYIVTANDAHGFPELYIKGYGWRCFEPTMTSDIEDEQKKDTSGHLAKWGVIFLIIALIALGIILIMPYLIHRIFLVIVKGKEPEKAVSAVVHRICKIYGIPQTSSVREAKAEVYRRADTDISSVAEMFERSNYGGFTLTAEDKIKAIETYTVAYIALKEAVKAEKKARKEKNRMQRHK